jgi:hypothetical protein
LATSTQSIPPTGLPESVTTLPQLKWGPWTRAFTPSFADCFFIALLAWLFVCGASGWKALLMDGDTGWHIRTGQYIIAHHAVPTQDLFSFSKPGAPWFAWEWLSDLWFAALYAVGGLKAIVLFVAALISAYATLLVRYSIWRGSNALLATFFTFLTVGSSTIHFLARPHLFTLILLPVCLWLIEADRRKNTRWVWLLVPVTAIWTNLHGGFLVFLACLALLVAGNTVEIFLGRRRWPEVRRYSALFVACSAASFLNPYGIALHTHIVEYLRADWIRNMVQEFQAPTFRSEGQLQFEALLLIGLVVTGFLLKRRMVTEALWILFLAHSSLTSVRHAPLFAAVAGPIVASELTAWWSASSAGIKKSSILGILHQLGKDITPSFRWTSVWPAAVILALALIDAPVKWPSDFPTEAFPIKMIHENADLLQSGRLLTTDQWGDYMIYSYYPKQKVFFDGRSDFYGEKLGQEYFHLLQGAYDWQAILRRHRFDVALLPVEWPLASLLKLDPAWKVVKDDSKAVLFVHLGHQSAVD